MKDFFKKYPICFYLMESIAIAVAVAFSLLIAKEYIYWNVINVAVYTAGLFCSFALNGWLLAFAKDRKLARTIFDILFIGAIGAAMPYIVHPTFNLWLKLDLYMTLRLMDFILFIILSAINLSVVFSTAETFKLKKRLTEFAVCALSVIMICVSLLPFSEAFLKTYFRAYSFLSEPSVFVGPNDNYSIMFATSGPGSAIVSVEKDGVTTEYPAILNGMLSYNSQVHRVDIPKSVLEGARYKLISKRALDTTGTVYRMGKTIESGYYEVRPYSGDGDVSFMCISDNQGTPKPTEKAVSAAAEKYDYDFVMMLGDQSEAYNEVEEDFINALLKISGIASHGAIPVYYTIGNHEYRGTMSETLWRTMPTPSENGELYYTFTMGDAYFTVLNFSNEDADDNERYGGLSRYAQYKDEEYEWLSAKFADGEYTHYTYNVVMSHIGVINERGKPAAEYKLKDYLDLLQSYSVGYVVSGHSHVAPQEFRAEGYTFANLHAGSYYNSKKQYRNSIVRLKDGTYSFEIYDSTN